MQRILPFVTISTNSTILKTTSHEQLTSNTTTAIAQRNIQRTAPAIMQERACLYSEGQNFSLCLLPNLVERYVQEVEGEITSYTTNTQIVSTKSRMQAVVIFLAARALRLAITNRALPSTIPKKNNNCSQSRQNYVHK